MPLSFDPLSSTPISSLDESTPPLPVPVLFPDWWTKTQRGKTIPSYLYVQYNDDDDLQAFVAAYNTLAQEIITWFYDIGLPVYTGELISGALLDWIAEGLYGSKRPVLPSGLAQLVGPYNTWAFNTYAFNSRRLVGSANYYVTSDDIFKRILTWNFFKGDGKVFDVRWLKRRIMRFLLGVNGTNPNIDNTYQISITFGLGNQVNIRLLNGLRTVVGGAIYNRFGFNGAGFNQLVTTFEQFAPLVDAAILKSAIDSGAVQLPFQFVYVVTIEDGPPSPYLYNDGGTLKVLASANYPSSAPAMAGSIWSNAGTVNVVVGVVPNPLAPPVYFPGISASGLLALGGGNLPLVAGPTGSNQLWNDSNVVKIS